jgi:hypothetical protein
MMMDEKLSKSSFAISSASSKSNQNHKHPALKLIMARMFMARCPDQSVPASQTPMNYTRRTKL